MHQTIMSSLPTLVLGTTDDESRRNIVKAFDENKKFFESRGIADARVLEEAIARMHPLSAKRARPMVFSHGFCYNPFERRIDGYSITLNEKSQVKDAFDASATLGVAYLYGFRSDHSPEQSTWVEAMAGLTSCMQKIGFWPSKTAPTPQYSIGKDQVITVLKDKVVDGIHYVYVLTRHVNHTPEEPLSTYVQQCNAKKGELDGIVDKAMRLLVAHIRGLDEKPENVTNDGCACIWSSTFNTATRVADTFVCNVGCYAASALDGPAVMRNPANGQIYVYSDTKINQDEYITRVSDSDRNAYLRSIRDARISRSGAVIPLGHPLAYVHSEKSDQYADFRQKQVTWCDSHGEVHFDKKTAHTETSRVMSQMAVVDSFAADNMLLLVARFSLQIYPPRDFTNMAHDDYVKFHVATRADHILVRTDDFSRIIYVLEHIRKCENEKLCDFATCDVAGVKYVKFGTRLLAPAPAKTAEKQ